MEDHKHLGQGEGLDLQRNPGHPHHVDTKDEDFQHAAHTAQQDAGHKDEILGQILTVNLTAIPVTNT